MKKVLRKILFWGTSPVWFTICVIGNFVQLIGYGIWTVGAIFHDKVMT